MSFTNPPRDYYSLLVWLEEFASFIITGSGGDEAANTVLAAPNGAPGLPTFRALVAADIPNLDASKITTGSFNASIIGSGTLNNARINFASPDAIGTGTPVAGTFTNLFSNILYSNHVAYNTTTSIANNAGTVIGFAGGITLTLPLAANRFSSPYSSIMFIKNIAGSSITIARAGSDLINDSSGSIILSTNTAVVLATTSATDWRSFGAT